RSADRDAAPADGRGPGRRDLQPPAGLRGRQPGLLPRRPRRPRLLHRRDRCAGLPRHLVRLARRAGLLAALRRRHLHRRPRPRSDRRLPRGASAGDPMSTLETALEALTPAELIVAAIGGFFVGYVLVSDAIRDFGLPIRASEYARMVVTIAILGI